MQATTFSDAQLSMSIKLRALIESHANDYMLTTYIRRCNYIGYYGRDEDLCPPIITHNCDYTGQQLFAAVPIAKPEVPSEETYIHEYCTPALCSCFGYNFFAFPQYNPCDKKDVELNKWLEYELFATPDHRAILQHDPKDQEDAYILLFQRSIFGNYLFGVLRASHYNLEHFPIRLEGCNNLYNKFVSRKWYETQHICTLYATGLEPVNDVIWDGEFGLTDLWMNLNNVVSQRPKLLEYVRPSDPQDYIERYMNGKSWDKKDMIALCNQYLGELVKRTGHEFYIISGGESNPGPDSDVEYEPTQNPSVRTRGSHKQDPRGKPMPQIVGGLVKDLPAAPDLRTPRRQRWLESKKSAVAHKTAIGPSNIEARRRVKKEIDPFYSVSPILRLDKHPDLTPHQRLVEYTAHRLCTHSKRFNRITQQGDIFVVDCDHNRESRGPNCEIKCLHCGAIRGSSVKRNCDCVVVYCPRCHFNTYDHTLTSHMCLCGAIHKDDTIQKDSDIDLDIFVSINKNAQDQMRTFLNNHVVRRLRIKARIPVQDLKSVPIEATPLALPPVEVEEPKEPTVEEKTIGAYTIGDVPITYKRRKERRHFKTEKQGGIITVANEAITPIMKAFTAFIDKMKGVFDNLNVSLKNTVMKYKTMKMKAEKLSLMAESLVKAYDMMVDLIFVLDAIATYAMLKPLKLFRILYATYQRFDAVYMALEAADFISSFLGWAAINPMYATIPDLAKTAIVDTFFGALTNVFKIHAQSGDLFSLSLFQPLIKALGINTLGIKSLIGPLREFNTVISASRNMSYLLGKLAIFLPSFIVRMFIATDTKTYIRDEMKKKSSLLRRAYSDALKVRLMVSRCESQYSITQARARAEDSLRLWFHQFHEEGGIVDRDMSAFLKIIKDTSSHVVPPRNREEEPFVVKISGPPGGGKSTNWPFLVAPLLPDNTIEDITKVFYSRNPSDEYWSGLSPEFIGVLYDDFNQSRKEEDLGEIISLVSKCDFIPNMASLTGENPKGTYFHPQFVVLCSNTDSVNATSLNCSQAINRRKHIHFRFTKIDPNQKASLANTAVTLLTDSKSFVRETRVNWKEAQQEVVNAYAEYKKDNRQIKQEFTTYKYGSRELPDNVYSDAIETVKNGGQLDEDGDVEEIKPVFHDATEGMIDRSLFGIKSTYGPEYHMPQDFDDQIFHPPQDWILLDLTQFLAMNEMHFFFIALVQLTTLGVVIYTLHKLLKHYAHVQSGETNTPYNPKTKVTANSSGPVQQTVVPIRRNIVKLALDDNHINNAIFVKGNIVLTNEHFFLDKDSEKYIAKGSRIRIFNTDASAPPEIDYFDPSKMTIIKFGDEKRDLVLYQFGKRIILRRDITNLFWDGSITLSNREVTIPLFENDLSFEMHHTRIIKDQIEIKYDVEYSGKVHEVSQHQSFMYAFSGKVGYCGTPILGADNETRGFILGIHTAGDVTRSFALIITRSQIEKALENYKDQTTFAEQAATGGYYAEVQSGDYSNASVNQYIFGRLTKPVYLPTKNDIVPSPLYGALGEPKTMPAILSRYDTRLPDGVDPYRYGIRKYVPSRPFPPGVLQEAIQSVIEERLSHTSTAGRGILTWHQAINGIEGKKYFDSIDMSTSPGFPFVYDHSQYIGDKLSLFTGVPGRYVWTDRLRDLVLEAEDQLGRGIIPVYPYIDYLKCERRPIEKALAGKTRIISASSLVMLLIVRKYFLSYVAHFYETRIRTNSAVGINRASFEWDTLVKNLLSVSDEGFDGDYSAWDGTVNYEAMLAFADIVNAYYDDEHSELRRTIMRMECHALHVFHDFIYIIQSGVSSGFGLTVVVNTDVNDTYLRVAWLLIMPIHLSSLHTFREKVKAGIYGDDNLVAVCKMLIQYYNAHTFRDALAPYGITYGAADKGTTLLASKPVAKCSFLKNNIGRLEGRYVPLMDWDAMMETTHWIRKTNDPDKACEDNCNCVLRNLFFYGAEKFNDIRARILVLKPTYNLLTYRSLHQEFFQYGCVWDPQGAYAFTRTKKLDPENVHGARKDLASFLLYFNAENVDKE